MRAAVYRGSSRVSVEEIPTPELDRGELLVRVETCGICHTDLKKIEHDLLAPPRVYGHEIAGVIAEVGPGVDGYEVGDRVVVFHHIPCESCFYCRRKNYAQCVSYKRVGVTAGFEPAGGGFSQYVRVMDWIVQRGIEKIPADVSFDLACWVEPVNTCLKAIRMLGLQQDDTVAILGQGSIGLIFTMLVKRTGARVVSSDTIPYRRSLALKLGAIACETPSPVFDRAVCDATNGRGADAVIVATSANGLVDQALKLSRPGGKILLFAQTSDTERIEVSGADICVRERMLLGSYSADVDLQSESADLVFSGELPLEDLITDRVLLSDIRTGIETALHPTETSLKVVIHPQDAA
jgi:L-iditol 2-dehydrogenase